MAAGKAGAIRAGRAFVELFIDDSQVQRGLQSAGRRIQDFGRSLRLVGYGLTGLAGVLAVPFIAGVKAAGDAIETINKFEQVFGDQAEAAAKFGDALAHAVGRSRYEMKDALASFQAFFVGLGFGAEKARLLSQETTHLALDFASLYNLPDQVAFDKFQSALAGLSRAVRAYGINVLEGAVNTEALALGISNGTRELTMQEKAIARFSIIQKTMTAQGAVGDAIRTADKYINRMKALRGAIYMLRVEIGNALLPTVTRYVDKAVILALATEKWARANGAIIRSIAKVVLIIGAVGVGLIAAGFAMSGIAFAMGGLAKGALLLVKAFKVLKFLIVTPFLLLGKVLWLVVPLVKLLGLVVAKAFAGLALMLVLIGKALILALSPVVLIIIGVAALGAAILWVSGAGGRALAWLGERFNDLKNIVVGVFKWIAGVGSKVAAWLRDRWNDLKDDMAKAWKGMGDALAAGDIGLAAEILWLTLKLEWAKGIGWLKEMWIDFKGFLLDTLASALYGLQGLWIKGISGMLSWWETFKAKTQTLWLDVKTKKEKADIEYEYLAAKSSAEFYYEHGEIGAEERDKRIADAATVRREKEAASGKTYEAELGSIEAAKEGMLTALVENEDAALAELKAKQAAQKAAAKTATDAEKAAIQAEVLAARGRWDAARKAAADAPKGPPVIERWKTDLAKFLEGLGGDGGAGKMGARMTGTFSSQALYGMGIGKDVFGRTAAAAEATARNTQRLADGQDEANSFTD